MIILLICITGIDGIGKSTQVKLLSDYLINKKFPISISKAFGPKERVLIEPFFELRNDELITLLFQIFHIKQRLEAEKSMIQGKIVIADRWDEAYLVYHSNFGFLSQNPEIRSWFNLIAFNDIKPDITFLLNTEIETAMQRQKNRVINDYFDDKPRDYFEVMRNGYLKLANANADRWHIIDATPDPNTIHLKIRETTNLRFGI